MTPQELQQITGAHQLFCGIETFKWNIDQFRQAAQFAKAHDVQTLLVKVADGTNEWYNGNFPQIRQTILDEGVGCIPYMYSYGRKYNTLAVECNIMQIYLSAYGIFCMDAEAEWNGDVAAAQYVCGRVQGQGIFMVSTWADPSLQNWTGVIAALAPCTNVFMPQQYNNYLATFWREFAANGATWLQPTVNLTQDFGANDPVAIAAAAHDQGHTAISVWYYDTAAANPGLLDAVYGAFPKGGTQPMSTTPTGWTDDGTTLTAPNGIHVVQGFRTFVLGNNWHPDNYPLEAEHGQSPLEISNPSLGDGTQQVFRWIVLEWSPDRGVFEAWGGQELLALRAAQTQTAIPQPLADAIGVVENDVAKLQGDIAAVQKVAASLPK